MECPVPWLVEMCLQGIMLVAFIKTHKYMYIQSEMTNLTTLFLAGLSHRGYWPLVCTKAVDSVEGTL